MGIHLRRGGRCALPTGAAAAAALAAVGATVLVGMSPAPVPPAPAPANATPPVAALQDANPTLVPAPVPPPAEENPPATRRAPRSTATAPPPTTSPPSTTARSTQRRPTPVAAPRAAGTAVLPSPEKVKDTPCTASARACVDLERKKAWLIEGGRVVRGPVVVRHGDSETPTPRGTFRVQWKAERYTSREYLRQMPYSVFFADGGIAFHEGTRDNPSAGCVKLAHEDAVAWFRFLRLGDEVQIH